MPYLIDGHNLIARLPDIELNDPNDEALLVQKLNGFVARTKQRCVVVFDHGLPGGESRLSTRGVRVVFASQRSNADHVIMDRIYKEPNPRMWTVVSSDNEVLLTARRKQMRTLRAEEFARLLQAPPSPPKPDPGESPDVRLTDAEIDEWLRLFGEESG